MTDEVTAQDQKYVQDVLLKAGVIATQIFKKEDPPVVFTIYELLVARAHARFAHGPQLCAECDEALGDNEEDD